MTGSSAAKIPAGLNRVKNMMTVQMRGVLLVLPAADNVAFLFVLDTSVLLILWCYEIDQQGL
jgi:hypothetical protein